MKAIDISHHQPANFPFQQYYDIGYEGVIIRTGDGLNVDKNIYTNLNLASQTDMDIGVYHFSRAKTFAEGLEEGKLVRELLEEYEPVITLGLFLDMEIYKTARWHTNAYNGFCSAFAGDDIEIGIYTCEYNYNNYFDKAAFAGVRKWIAKYSKTVPNIGQEIWGWQYTRGTNTNEPYKMPLDRSIIFGKVDENDGTIGKGEPGKAEVDIWWVINGILENKYGTGEERKAAMDAIGVDYADVQSQVNRHYAVALDVLAGKYGNQPKRKPLVEAAGYNYEVVQKIVNAIKG